MNQTPEQQASRIAQEYTETFTTFFTAIDEATTASLRDTMRMYPLMSRELFYLFCGILCVNTRTEVNKHPDGSQILFGAFATFSGQIPQQLQQKEQHFNLHKIQCVTNPYSTSQHNKLAQLFLIRSIGADYPQQYSAANALETALETTIDMAENQLHTLIHAPL